MIHYALRCEAGHSFESWFPSSDAFEAQRAQHLVACPLCGSARVDKQMMAPRIGGRTELAAPAAEPAAAAPPTEPAAPAPAQPVALMASADAELRAKLKALRAELIANSDYVGRQFPDEARRMHEGEIEHRSIWGEATAEEARALVEDGVEVMPLPPRLDDRN